MPVFIRKLTVYVCNSFVVCRPTFTTVLNIMKCFLAGFYSGLQGGGGMILRFFFFYRPKNKNARNEISVPRWVYWRYLHTTLRIAVQRRFHLFFFFCKREQCSFPVKAALEWMAFIGGMLIVITFNHFNNLNLENVARFPWNCLNR